MSAAAAAGVATLKSREYDVFINHRGPDVGKTFGAHLYAALSSHGIRPFLDAKDIWCVEPVFEEIDKALKGACVHVAIFSKGYAESKYCLDELCAILKSERPIIPVFYDVEAEDLRRPEDGPYKEAFEKHRKCGRTKKIPIWKEALHKVADYMAFQMDEVNGNEVLLIRRIVVEVRNALPPDLLPGIPFGLEKSMKDVVKTLQSVSVIGLVGMGGIGKTTLAMEVYNHFVSCQRFERYCFLKDVRSSQTSVLQNNVLRDLGLGFESHYNDQPEYTCTLRRALKDRSVLVIVDDISDPNQFKALIPEINELGLECRIVITSRGRDVLKDVMKTLPAASKAMYEVELLDKSDSRRLFNIHAFMSETPSEGFVELAETISDACGGLPLSLKVMGCSLFNKNDKEIWLEALKMLQENFTFKPDNNKKASLSRQVQTESVEPLSEGMTSDVTMSVELESMPQMIQPMDIGHDPTSCNEGSKESSSPVPSSFCEELHRLTRSLSLRKVPTPREQSANLTLDQFLDNHHLHNPRAMLIAGRVQVSNCQSVQFVFKDGEELAQVVGVGCFGQHAVVNITKSLKVQVVHDEDAWHQIWNEAIIGGSSSQLMTFSKNSRSQSTIDDVTTLGNLSSQRLAKQFGVGLECASHVQSSVKVHNQEKGRQEFLILMFARYLLLDEILETKCHDDYVEAFEQNFPFCEESNALRKSANLPDGVSSGEWIWTSTLWANLWNYLPGLVKNVGNTQLGTGRGGIGDGGHGDGGDGGDGGRDRDDNSGGDGVLPLPPPDLDLENDGFAIVEVHPGYGGRWDNKDLVDKDLQVSTITPILTFRFEKSKERRELNVVLSVTFDLGEVVGPKPRDREELRFGWFHNHLGMSLQSSDDDAAFLKSNSQAVDVPEISTTTSSTSSSITSNPFHVSFEAPGCSRSSPSSFIGFMGTLGISKDFNSRNTQVMEMTTQLISRQVLGGFHYQDQSTANKNSELAFRYVFPSIPNDMVIHDDTTRNIYMLSGLGSTISPTVRGTWHQLNMSEASPYTFHSSRTFYEILASKKKRLRKENDCKSFEQTYDLKLYINHAMTHIYEYIGKRNILEGLGKSCHLLDVGSVQEG